MSFDTTPRAFGEERRSLSRREVLKFYAPLALSWLFMAIELPVAVSILSRLPDAKINTAALLMTGAVALFIESPVIDLLATSTTLAKNRQHYLTIRRFVIWLMVLVTTVHAVVSLTPVYDFTVRPLVQSWRFDPNMAEAFRSGALALGIPVAPALQTVSDKLVEGQLVADAIRPALIIMIPWSAFIGWRRYLQGIMIRHGRTKVIGAGTALRVSSIFIVGYGLYFSKLLPGMVVVATALICSVAAESVFMHQVSKRTIRERYGVDTDEDHVATEPLTIRQLARFHLPLSASTMVTLVGMPVVGAALARAPDSILSMAGWQVASSMLFLPRSVTYALTEVVIALFRDRESLKILFGFCFRVALFTTGLVAVACVLGFDTWFFRNVLGAESDVSSLAHLAFFCCMFVPGMNALMSYLRGMLTAKHMTVSRLYAILVGTSLTVVILVIGVRRQWSGVITASSAMTLGQLSELVVLAVSWRYSEARRHSHDRPDFEIEPLRASK